MDERLRLHGRDWLANWHAAGQVLEAERLRELQALDDDAAWAQAEALAQLWEPGWTGDDGDALLRHQDVFARRATP